MRKFTFEEIKLLIALLEGDKAGIELLRGFRSMTPAEQEKNDFYNSLQKKLEDIIYVNQLK